MNNRDYQIREAGAMRLRECREMRAAAKKAQERYLASEQFQRDRWDNAQNFWAKKAKKEGWNYTKQPFVSAADRQRIAEQKRQEEIAYLQERIAALQGEAGGGTGEGGEADE